MSIRLYGLVAMLCLWHAPSRLTAQNRPLWPGDTLPQLHLLAQAKNGARQQPLPVGQRTLLLDFFATWCGACVAELPRLAALQQQYKNELQILLVSREPAAKLLPLLRKKGVDTCGIDWMAADTLLHQFFPHRLLPHKVWMAGSGRVLGITNSTSLDAPYLHMALEGRLLPLPVKRDQQEQAGKRLLADKIMAGETNQWEQVTASAALPEYGYAMGSKALANQRRRFYGYNVPRRQLITQAFNTRLIVAATAAAGQWLDEPICFEVIMQDTSAVVALKMAANQQLLRFAWQWHIDSLPVQQWQLVQVATPKVPPHEVSCSLAALAARLNQSQTNAPLHWVQYVGEKTALAACGLPPPPLAEWHKLQEWLGERGLALEAAPPSVMPVLFLDPH